MLPLKWSRILNHFGTVFRRGNRCRQAVPKSVSCYGTSGLEIGAQIGVVLRDAWCRNCHCRRHAGVVTVAAAEKQPPQEQYKELCVGNTRVPASTIGGHVPSQRGGHPRGKQPASANSIRYRGEIPEGQKNTIKSSDADKAA